MVQEADGVLSVEIPPRRNQAALLLAILIGGSALAMVLVVQFRLIHPIHGHLVSPGVVSVLRMLQIADVLAAGYVIAAVYTGTRKLMLSMTRLEVCYFVLGVPIGRRSFDCADVRSLRYEQWQVQAKNKTIERSGIRFEVGSATHSFGTSISAARAAEMIGRMRAVCPGISVAQ